jgi:hypothetical protein
MYGRGMQFPQVSVVNMSTRQQHHSMQPCHLKNQGYSIINTGWCRETVKCEIIRKKRRELNKTLFDPENVFYKSGNFIRHHFLKITSVKCCPFRS